MGLVEESICVELGLEIGTGVERKLQKYFHTAIFSNSKRSM
jgi:hypothetical protein